MIACDWFTVIIVQYDVGVNWWKITGWMLLILSTIECHKSLIIWYFCRELLQFVKENDKAAEAIALRYSLIALIPNRLQIKVFFRSCKMSPCCVCSGARSLSRITSVWRTCPATGRRSSQTTVSCSTTNPNANPATTRSPANLTGLNFDLQTYVIVQCPGSEFCTVF